MGNDKIKLKLISNFSDYYDDALVKADCAVKLWHRPQCGVLSKKEQFDLLVKLGLGKMVPPHGTCLELFDLIPDELLLEMGETQNVNIYLDHSGFDYLPVNMALAAENYPEYFCSLEISEIEEANISYSWYKIGHKDFVVKKILLAGGESFASYEDDFIISGKSFGMSGDMLPETNIPVLLKSYPICRIDFILSETDQVYATAVDTSPVLKGTAIERTVGSDEIVSLLVEWFNSL